VLGLAALVAAVGHLLTQQAVVLDVVDDLEEGEPEHRLHDQEREHGRAEGGDECPEQHHGHGPRVQDVVLR